MILSNILFKNSSIFTDNSLTLNTLNINILMRSISIDKTTNKIENTTGNRIVFKADCPAKFINKSFITYFHTRLWLFIRYIENADGAINIITFLKFSLNLILENKIIYNIPTPKIVGDEYIINECSGDVSRPYILYSSVITHRNIIPKAE